jgi:hypothetical protein
MVPHDLRKVEPTVDYSFEVNTIKVSLYSGHDFDFTSPYVAPSTTEEPKRTYRFTKRVQEEEMQIDTNYLSESNMLIAD